MPDASLPVGFEVGQEDLPVPREFHRWSSPAGEAGHVEPVFQHLGRVFWEHLKVGVQGRQPIVKPLLPLIGNIVTTADWGVFQEDSFGWPDLLWRCKGVRVRQVGNLRPWDRGSARLDTSGSRSRGLARMATVLDTSGTDTTADRRRPVEVSAGRGAKCAGDGHGVLGDDV